jgi:hypothetical protein
MVAVTVRSSGGIMGATTSAEGVTDDTDAREDDEVVIVRTSDDVDAAVYEAVSRVR